MYFEEKEFIITQIEKVVEKYINASHLTVIEQKTEFDLVTDIDKKIEKELIDAIHKKYPNDTFISEEMNPLNSVNKRTWIIDPIDGTCNMAHNMKIFGIQCALCYEGNPVMSVIYLPYLNEVYFAILGEGSYLNNKRIYTSNNVSLNNCIVSYGDYTHKEEKIANLQHKSIGIMFPQIAKIRMFGAACFDFSFVASGKTDGCVVLTRNLWDIVPGILLSLEAGASIYDINGEEYRIGSYGAIVTGNPSLKEKLLSSFKAKK